MASIRHDHDDHGIRSKRFNLSSKYQNINLITAPRIKDDHNQRSTMNHTEIKREIKRPQSSFDNVFIPPSAKEMRKPTKSRKTPSRSPSPPQSFPHRKSAIKDVMKQFQCNNDQSRMNTTVMCQPLRSSPRTSPLRERSSALKQNQNRNDLHSTMLDNSLLDESVMDSIPYSLHYSKERNRAKMSHSSTKSSPLQKLFQQPFQTCGAQFIHEPETMDAKASYGCNLFSNQDNANEDDGNILGFSSNFSKEELDTVFRRPRSLQSSKSDLSNECSLDDKLIKSSRSSHGSDRDRNFTTPSVHKNSSKFTEPASASTAQTEVSTPDLKDLNFSMDESKSSKQSFRRETSATDLRLEQALFELDAKNKILKQISDEKDQIERKMHEMESQYRNSQQDKENIEASFLLDSFISEEETENQMRELTKLRKINHQARLEINQEKKKNEELQNQIRALQSESLYHRHHSNTLNDSHKPFQQEHEQFGSNDNTKDTLVMKVDIVSLKSKLSNVEHLLKQEKEAREMDRNQFKKDESRLQTQIQKLMKSLTKGKTSAQYSALEAQLQIQKENNELLQERLAESEVYISTLEKTMDDQLKAWKEEEDDFKKESSTLREKAARTVAIKEALHGAKEHIKTLEHELSASKREIARLSSQEDCEMDHNKESPKESVEHLLELANELRIENDELRKEMKLVNKSLENSHMSVENQYKSEINRLKEELKHATFRLQIMKNSSSPTRKHQIGNSSLVHNHNNNDYQGGGKGFITEASPEGQKSLLKEPEDAAKKKIINLQNDIQELKSTNASLIEEAAVRKRIELALRDEISSLREVKIESCSNSILPSVPKTHPNITDSELQKLEKVVSLLHELIDAIVKAQLKKNRNVPLLEKIVNHVADLKITFMLVSAASEEDKARVENAFQIYMNTIQSYEAQLTELRKKLDKTKQDLCEQQSQRADDLKKLKQSEIDNLAKFSILKQKFSCLEKEHQVLNARLNLCSNGVSIPDKSSKENAGTRQNNTLNMKIQHTASEDEVEIKLHEKDSFLSSFSDPDFSIKREPSPVGKSQNKKDLVIEARFLDRTGCQLSKSSEGLKKDSGENSVLLSVESTFEKDNPSDEYSKLYTLDDSNDVDSFAAEDGSMTHASF